MRCKARKNERGRMKLLRHIDIIIKYQPEEISLIAEMLACYRQQYGTGRAYQTREDRYKGLEDTQNRENGNQ